MVVEGDKQSNQTPNTSMNVNATKVTKQKSRGKQQQQNNSTIDKHEHMKKPEEEEARRRSQKKPEEVEPCAQDKQGKGTM